MLETTKFLKSTSLDTLLRWIESEKNPVKRRAFEVLKAQKMELVNPHMNEVLKVVKDSKFDFTGFRRYNKSISDMLEMECEEVTRSYAEYNSTYRQLVANVILEASVNNKKIYGFLKRGKGYTESELVGSIGMIGGHVNNGDTNIFCGLVREVSEEVKNISFDTVNFEPYGYIRDEDDSISRQHLCVLYVIKLDSNANLKIRSSEDKEKFIWMSVEEIQKEIQKSEDSQLDSWALTAIKEYLSEDSNIEG